MDSIIKTEFSFIDETLVKGFTSTKKLTVFLSHDGFSYTITKASSDEILALEVFFFQHPQSDASSDREICEKISSIFGRVEWLSRKYASNTFVYRGHQATLIPSTLFDPADAISYLNLNHPVAPDDEAKHVEMKAAGAQIVFSVPNCLPRALSNFFQQYSLTTYVYRLLNFSFPEARLFKKKPFVCVDIHPGMFYLVVIRDNHLIFVNSFHYHTHEDLIYYLVFALKQLEIPTLSTRLNITGRVRRDSVMIESLNRYFRNIDILRSGSNKILLDRAEQETGFVPQILLL